MASPRDLKLPARVLAQAKAAVPVVARSPAAPQKGKKPTAREKVVAALKKLHPMD